MRLARDFDTAKRTNRIISPSNSSDIASGDDASEYEPNAGRAPKRRKPNGDGAQNQKSMNTSTLDVFAKGDAGQIWKSAADPPHPIGSRLWVREITARNEFWETISKLSQGVLNKRLQIKFQVDAGEKVLHDTLSKPKTARKPKTKPEQVVDINIEDEEAEDTTPQKQTIPSQQDMFEFYATQKNFRDGTGEDINDEKGQQSARFVPTEDEFLIMPKGSRVATVTPATSTAQDASTDDAQNASDAASEIFDGNAERAHGNMTSKSKERVKYEAGDVEDHDDGEVAQRTSNEPVKAKWQSKSF